MGDAADDLSDEMFDALARHNAGMCQDYCQWCEEDEKTRQWLEELPGPDETKWEDL